MRRSAVVSSTVAFALAVLVTITWHELGHAFAALAQGRPTTVRPFSVDAGSGSDVQEIVMALAGPLLSLATGLALMGWYRTRRPAGFWGLFLLWLALTNVQEFAGYLVTGPFFSGGDIGHALELANAPLVVALLLFVVGWAITYANGRVATDELMRLCDGKRPLAPQLRDLGLFAWLAGSALAVLVSVGAFDFGEQGLAGGLFEILGTLTVGIFLIFVRLFMRRGTQVRIAATYAPPYAGAAALVVVAAARQLVLAPGLHM